MKDNRDRLKEAVFGDDPKAAEQALQEASGEDREELHRLFSLRQQLESLPPEDPPRSIVLAAPARPQGLLGFLHLPAPAWAFAAAMVLAAAIVFHAVYQPAPSGLTTSAESTIEDADYVSAEELQKLQASFDTRLEEALQRQADELEARYSQRTEQVVAETEQRIQEQNREEMESLRQAFWLMKNQYGRLYIASSSYGETQP
jgi:hypothetical protein